MQTHLLSRLIGAESKILTGEALQVPRSRAAYGDPEDFGWIQQMLLNVLQPIFDPLMREHSYGFRPGDSAHHTVGVARAYVQGGRIEWLSSDFGSRFILTATQNTSSHSGIYLASFAGFNTKHANYRVVLEHMLKTRQHFDSF